MPSCSTSSNISSAINSLSITQGSGGSRLAVAIDIASAPGLTAGQVIRYDVATAGYTASKADTPSNSEVFGIIESCSASTQKFNVVLNGSITISNSDLINLPSDPTGALGGNDIYFLSGQTGGALQNLAPSNLDHIIKPVYQKAPHGTFTGSVVNYSGYKMGGDVQAALDTTSLFAQVGSVQFIFKEAVAGYDEEERLLKEEGFDYTGTGTLPILDRNPSLYYEWKLEHIRFDDGNHILRSIDFPEYTQKIGPNFNAGWIERVKVDSEFNVTSNDIGKHVIQYNHNKYNSAATTPPQNLWYGTIIGWDSTNSYLYIRRPTLGLFTEFTYAQLLQYLAETSITSSSQGKLKIFDGNLPGVGNSTEITIRNTNTAIQFVGFITPKINWEGELNETDSNFPFRYGTDYDLFNNSPLEGNPVFTRVYMKIKNRGVSVVIPTSVTVNDLTSNTIVNNSVDLQTKLTELENRIAALETPS